MLDKSVSSGHRPRTAKFSGLVGDVDKLKKESTREEATKLNSDKTNSIIGYGRKNET